MGIFTRLRDIISSNINAMLDKAEDPEKLIRLMIQEMEDTLVEIKAQCAAAMAQNKTFERLVSEARERVEHWADKARLAVEKLREDLAREALMEKRRNAEQAESLETQRVEYEALIRQYQNDIVELEGKIASVREKQRVLIERHNHAHNKKRAQEHIRRVDTSDVLARFDGFERRVDRLEAEADLVNYARRGSLDQRFSEITGDEGIEKELEDLKTKAKK